MVIICEFSSFPIVKLLKSLNANNVIKVWRKVFRLFGYPKEVKTDNGPPFQSCLVRQFLFENNIKHRKITPLWPRENAICERFMRSINRVMNIVMLTKQIGEKNCGGGGGPTTKSRGMGYLSTAQCEMQKGKGIVKSMVHFLS